MNRQQRRQIVRKAKGMTLTNKLYHYAYNTRSLCNAFGNELITRKGGIHSNQKIGRSTVMPFAWVFFKPKNDDIPQLGKGNIWGDAVFLYIRDLLCCTSHIARTGYVTCAKRRARVITIIEQCVASLKILPESWAGQKHKSCKNFPHNQVLHKFSITSNIYITDASGVFE